MHDLSAHRRLYEAIREQLPHLGTATAGRISPQRIADAGRVSVTPVREALFRLIGERLVDLHLDGGFAIADQEASELADLQAWNGHHLLAALHLLTEPLVVSVLEANRVDTLPRRHPDVVGRLEAFFDAIGRATGNGEFVLQIGAANRRLRRARLVEDRLFTDAGRELRSLVRHETSDVKANVRRRIHAYHRRRVEHAGQVAALLAGRLRD